jgi:hypothetical protein
MNKEWEDELLNNLGKLALKYSKNDSVVRLGMCLDLIERITQKRAERDRIWSTLKIDYD